MFYNNQASEAIREDAENLEMNASQESAEKPEWELDEETLRMLGELIDLD